MLDVNGLHVDYGGFRVLKGVDMSVGSGEIVTVLGPNGAGKSTLMNAISGLVTARRGTIVFDDEPIENVPAHKRVERGIAHVLERHHVFPFMSVEKNLTLGAYARHAKQKRDENFQKVMDYFPALKERLRQAAGALSGGLQQQLAIARGLMSEPRLIMLDEPFLGLAPLVVEEIVEMIRRLQRDGLTVLFIEQNVERALEIADRGYILESGQVAVTGTRAALLADGRVREVYLGDIATQEAPGSLRPRWDGDAGEAAFSDRG